MSYEKRLAKLETARGDLLATDILIEAARKILVTDFMALLRHEAGSRSGEDPEDVHQMRVAIRRMRSLLRLIKQNPDAELYEWAAEALKTLGGILGIVRDLDVLIDNLGAYGANQPEEQQVNIQAIVARMDKRRNRARAKLVEHLDSKKYRTFVREFSKQLRKPVTSEAETPHPHQLRHILPTILHQQLATVRAYDTIMADISTEQLHALRLDCKRLRYTLDFFQPVTGSSMGAYIQEVKNLQEILGRLNDIETARTLLVDKKFTDDEQAIIEQYIAFLETEAQAGLANFEDVWARFNGRTVQRKFSDALLVLR